ncbi:MAG: hypothetical protein ACT452_06660 [Microthrixaceae bacterium]
MADNDDGPSCAFCDRVIVRESPDPLCVGITYSCNDCDEPPDDTMWAHHDCFRAALHPASRELHDLMGVPEID